jgi:outer membrane protein OmpA-like peptidoglycan-associated protein
MSFRGIPVGLSMLLLTATLSGCVTADRAKPYAALRSSCPPDKIEVIEQNDSDAILDVCGVYEDWHWNAFNGWGYVGPSARQPVSGPVDGDGDGVPDDIDACPALAGVATADPKTNGCPPASDADSDGISDDVDACPQQAGVQNADPKKNGCPPPGDADGDGVTDDVDACPNKKGVSSTDPAKNGCPGDSDGDGINDDSDACPNEAGKPNADPAKNGCPVVQITKGEIKINEKVQFDTGKATIKEASGPLLDQIAQVMKDHPEIKKIEVQGHTDDQGKKYFNQQLSAARAQAVAKALEDRGVDKSRMEFKGYGQEEPIADNATEEGRAKNRRVQFKILERDDAAAKPPTPPPAKP